MSFTIEQYTALKEAIATGATTITYGDKTVSYRSLAEMKDLVRMIEDELFRNVACVVVALLALIEAISAKNENFV